MDIVSYWRGVVRPYLVARCRVSERGASLIEYALLVALIALVCVGALTFLGNSTAPKLSSAGSALSK